MNTNDTKPNRQTIQVDHRTVALLDLLDSATQRRLALLALELLGCLANGTDKILDYELKEEMEQAGLEAFYEENESRLRGLRRTSPN